MSCYELASGTTSTNPESSTNLGTVKDQRIMTVEHLNQSHVTRPRWLRRLRTWTAWSSWTRRICLVYKYWTRHSYEVVFNLHLFTHSLRLLIIHLDLDCSWLKTLLFYNSLTDLSYIRSKPTSIDIYIKVGSIVNTLNILQDVYLRSQNLYL